MVEGSARKVLGGSHRGLTCRARSFLMCHPLNTRGSHSRTEDPRGGSASHDSDFWESRGLGACPNGGGVKDVLSPCPRARGAPALHLFSLIPPPVMG